jgi:uncharacterized phage infection (PIP) family protein YhgE
MLNLASWSTKLQNLFNELTMAMQSLKDTLSSTSRSEAEKKLEEYGRELANGSHQFSSFKNTYRDVVKTYLERFPPAFSEDLANNLREYDKLIVFSLRSSDKTLLEEWGIAKPRSQKLTWIDDPSSKRKYAQGLNELRAETPGAEEYYDYLINHFVS